MRTNRNIRMVKVLQCFWLSINEMFRKKNAFLRTIYFLGLLFSAQKPYFLVSTECLWLAHIFIWNWNSYCVRVWTMHINVVRFPKLCERLAWCKIFSEREMCIPILMKLWDLIPPHTHTNRHGTAVACTHSCNAMPFVVANSQRDFWDFFLQSRRGWFHIELHIFWGGNKWWNAVRSNWIHTKVLRLAEINLFYALWMPLIPITCHLIGFDWF